MSKIGEYIVYAVLGAILLYAAVRIAGAAWFKSKRQFDQHQTTKG